MIDKFCLYISNTKLFIWYTDGIIFKNWLIISIILIAILISDFKLNKPYNYILKLWKLIKALDQKSKFIYKKRDSTNPARLNTISDKSINKNIT